MHQIKNDLNIFCLNNLPTFFPYFVITQIEIMIIDFCCNKSFALKVTKSLQF